MAYTPELSYQSSCTLRRIAWALNIPMTEAIERVFEHLPRILDKRKICQGAGTMPDATDVHLINDIESFKYTRRLSI